MRSKTAVAAIASASLAGMALMPVASLAAPAANPTGAAALVRGSAPSDALPNPLADKQSELKQSALEAVLTGEATARRVNGSTVVELGRGSGTSGSDYVELAREQKDNIFVIVTEFGKKRDPRFPDRDTDPDTPGPVKYNGPVHNKIPEPDRTLDNSTLWQANYDVSHYEDMYFGDKSKSVKSYFERQSSGRYTVGGRVEGWVKVPYNQARYGRSGDYTDSDPNVCASIVCENTWALIRDGVKAWVARERAAGQTKNQIAAGLARFDKWDRYDHDGDGNFNESDGYLDHFQIVHAGGDEAAADPIYGEDAIWSHRWYAYANRIGVTGPQGNKLGGAQIGHTGLWVGDYTIQPENGGLGVFVHEYGHDLGLPDEYDTSYAGESPAAFWTLMSAGSNLDGDGTGIGSVPNDLNAWDKLQLGWLNYGLAEYGDDVTRTLGPAEYNTRKKQALITLLPDKNVSVDYGDPFAGAGMWWTSRGNDLTTTMSRTIDLTGATTSSLTMQAKYDIEADYDYFYAEVSTDGGTTWTSVAGTADGSPIGTDGVRPALSGSSSDAWVALEYPLDAYAGQSVELRLRYTTDPAVSPYGLFADEISVDADGTPLFTSGAEGGDEGWTLDGFTSTSGEEENEYFNAYIAENRLYLSYDKSLRKGPYNFGFLDVNQNWVEHFPYRPGLLISYWDTSQADNNTGEHPGSGLILPIDSHPYPRYWSDGTAMRTRIQVADAAFGLSATKRFVLHRDSVPTTVTVKPAVPLFDDLKKYWYAEKPDSGVLVPKTGTRIEVLSRDGHQVTVRVYPSP